MKQIRLFIFLFFALCSKNLFATAQYGDKLIVNGDTIEIFSNPLEIYFEKKGTRIIGKVDLEEENEKNYCTALWRGYVATWKLEKDSLFLIRIQTDYCGDNPKDIDIKEEFGSKKVFADWVNMTAICPYGELLHYVHMGYESIYEGEKHYIFEQGKLIDTRAISYLERDNNLLFPGVYFLEDTIRSLIFDAIDKVELTRINADEYCCIIVSFDKNGEISYIGFDKEQEPKTITEEIIIRKAKEVLKGFPKLMKVNHENYYPPNVGVCFSGHCMKFHGEAECWCDCEESTYSWQVGLLIVGLIILSIFIIRQIKRKSKKTNNQPK